VVGRVAGNPTARARAALAASEGAASHPPPRAERVVARRATLAVAAVVVAVRVVGRAKRAVAQSAMGRTSALPLG
jgi:hypothetical protein